MKIKAIITVFLVTFVITSRTPAATPTPIQTPAAVETSTSALSATLTLIPPTETSAPTPTPSPTIEVKLADLPQTKAAVDQFAAAMKSVGFSSGAIRRAIY
jgi:hypothetical protein